VSSTAAIERQIRGIILHVDASSDTRATMLKADARLLAAALAGLVGATAALVDATSGQSRTPGEPRTGVPVRLRVSIDNGEVWLNVVQNAVDLPSAWLARPFDIAWPIRDGAAALTQLQAARKIAQAHGGDLELTGSDGGTTVSMRLPLASPS
jgi:nitrogen fixation/metabolism regulation signal transduction histidine kinase